MSAQENSFTTIALLGKFDDPQAVDSMLTLVAYLAQRDRRVLIDSEVDATFAASGVERVTEGQLIAQADLIVVVGGDGTMLHAARLAAQSSVPLLGVNRGRLGFLTDISPKDMCDRIDDVLAGRFVRESRTLLEAQLIKEGAPRRRMLAMNDVVLQKWETGRMLDFETWIDGNYVNTHGGDGLVIATATGSTAYALSCGGPIIHPDVDALVLAPICPHTLSDRPIVIRASSKVELRLIERFEIKGQITCDGVAFDSLSEGDRLMITQSEAKVSLLHPPGHDYYRILRSKLYWGRGGQGQRSVDS
jgi:NAD+ kinase